MLDGEVGLIKYKRLTNGEGGVNQNRAQSGVDGIVKNCAVNGAGGCIQWKRLTNGEGGVIQN